MNPSPKSGNNSTTSPGLMNVTNNFVKLDNASSSSVGSNLITLTGGHHPLTNVGIDALQQAYSGIQQYAGN
jgi:hypothetical protein